MMSQKLSEITECLICGAPVASDDTFEPYCLGCLNRYPASLLKAHMDPFDYVLMLRTGEAIAFYEANIRGDYVHLTLGDGIISDRDLERFGLKTVPFGSHRGIDVRVDDIVWCVDAPMGS